MPVTGILSYTLEVPILAQGVKFYGDAGLQLSMAGEDTANFRCSGQIHDCITLIGGTPSKRLHHITLRANGIDTIGDAVVANEGKIVATPSRFGNDGLWVTDPHGMLIHLVDGPEEQPLAGAAPFQINGPGTLVRIRRSGVLPRATYGRVEPRRLGHVLVFTPDVMKSVAFMSQALGMELADRAQDVIAFCCVRTNSDHHVVAFAKSSGVGFHHASFQVADPDEVGRGGRDLVTATGRGDWGVGRHTIGSNFFHYIQDPWGSWFEYYSDMDFIDDYKLWSPQNYDMADSLANWGPAVPTDFVHNYEADA
jgi:catechol 2,3-dioxygenase-like lactoylglutathione lyase family enzyme